MFEWAMFFFIFALVAGVLGFGGVAGTAVGIAKVLFYLGLGFSLVMLVLGFTRKSGRMV